MKFTYGNTHKTIKNWVNPRRPNDPPKETNEWKMYITINGKTQNTAKYIKQVTYELHPTYRDNIIKVTEAPFAIRRLAYGYFDLKMTVEFKAFTGLKPMNITHSLVFNDSFTEKTEYMEINDMKPEPKPAASKPAPAITAPLSPKQQQPRATSAIRLPAIEEKPRVAREIPILQGSTAAAALAVAEERKEARIFRQVIQDHERGQQMQREMLRPRIAEPLPQVEELKEAPQQPVQPPRVQPARNQSSQPARRVIAAPVAAPVITNQAAAQQEPSPARPATSEQKTSVPLKQEAKDALALLAEKLKAAGCTLKRSSSTGGN